MNLLTRLQTIILTSLLLGLLFSLAILPSPASAENHQKISCTVSFDWTEKEQKREMNGDITMSLFFGDTKLYNHTKFMSNSEFKKKDSVAYDVYDVLKRTQDKNNYESSQSTNFNLKICDNPYQGISGTINRLRTITGFADKLWRINKYICVNISASPTCTKNNDTSTQRTIKFVEDYNAFVGTPDEKKCTVSFENLPERSQSSGIPDDSSEIAYVKSQETGKNIWTRMYKQDRSIVVDVEKDGNYLINAPSRANEWIGPVAAVCSPKPTTTTLQTGEIGGDISGEEKSTPASKDIDKKTTPTISPVADPTPTISPTSAPPAASSPSPTQKATPTTTNEQPVGAGGQTGQANSCPTNLSNVSADADGQDGVTIRDFNKIRTCVKNGSTNQTQLPFSGETGWAMAVWKKAFLAK